MCVVLPRDGDAAVHLRVQVGAQICGRRSERRGNGGGVRELVAARRRGPGGVPHRARGQFGGDGHVGAVVLHGLVHGNRATELDALLGVGGGHLGALACHTDGVSRQDDASEIDEHAVSPDDHRDRRTVEGHPDAPAARVEAHRRVDRHPVAHLHDGHIVTDRDQDHRCQPATEHHAGIARCGPVRHRHRTAECDGADRRSVGEPRQQP